MTIEPWPQETPFDYARRVLATMTDDQCEVEEAASIMLPWRVPRSRPEDTVKQCERALQMVRSPSAGDYRVINCTLHVYDGGAWREVPPE